MNIGERIVLSDGKENIGDFGPDKYRCNPFDFIQSDSNFECHKMKAWNFSIAIKKRLTCI